MELLDQHTKTLVLRAYKRALSSIKGIKALLVFLLIITGFKVLLDAYYWESFSFWKSGWFYLYVAVHVVFGAIAVFKFPHRFLSAPPQRRKVSVPEEGEVRELYDLCIKSLKLGFPLVDPKTGKLTASNLP